MRHDRQTLGVNPKTATRHQALAAVAAPAEARPARTPVGDHAAFLFEFLRHPQQIGSVVPSSPFLEDRLVRETDARNARTLVELGPGTGGTTRALLRAMRADARLLAIDLSATFCARLTATVRDPRLIIRCGSAEHIGQFLQECRLPNPDAILSGIPFSTMPSTVADRIAHAIATVLAPNGRFVAYQVRPHVAGYLTPRLGAPRRDWELLNVPPMRVFTWSRAA